MLQDTQLTVNHNQIPNNIDMNLHRRQLSEDLEDLKTNDSFDENQHREDLDAKKFQILVRSFEIKEQLKRNVFDNLRSIHIAYPNKFNIDKKNQCSICSKTIKNYEKCITLSCIHIFHFDCLKQRVDYDDRCPLCNRTIFSIS